jgi:hypothetical protein
LEIKNMGMNESNEGEQVVRVQMPWAKMDLKAFAKAMANYGCQVDVQTALRNNEEVPRRSPGYNDFILKVEVSATSKSGFWWTIKWTGEDGRRHWEAGPWLEDVLWDAANKECRKSKAAAEARVSIGSPEERTKRPDYDPPGQGSPSASTALNSQMARESETGG